MTIMAIQKEDLKLNRKLQNHVFSSWRLSPGSLAHQQCIQLPDPVSTCKSDAVDYLHTRASVLRNHLLESEGRLFCFLAGGNTELQVAEVSCQGSGSQTSCKLQRLTVLSGQALPSEAGPVIDARVDPSVAVLHTSANASTSDGHAQLLTPPSLLHGALLVSRGDGDLTLLYSSHLSGQGMQQSSVVYPLRPLPPLAGHRSLMIEAAYALPTGELRCIAWAVKSAAESSTPATAKPARHTTCETFAITLSVNTSAAAAAAVPVGGAADSGPAAAAAGIPSSQVRLEVVNVRLLRDSALPPHLVMVNPGQDAVLLGLDPESCSEEADHAEEEVMHIDCRNPAGNVDLDEDPRSLQEAADHLAKYTSDQVEREIAHQQWADIYKESGPDGVGAMGGEPAMDLILLPAAGGVPLHTTSGSVPRSEWHLSCGASRVLASESAASGLIGLSDDVDCAVVSVSWPPSQREPSVVHESYVPALAYVAAGKVHKKHLLLGRLHSPIAAVLVEATKLYYVYRKTSNRQEFGLQDMVDMELQDGESILGARLVELGGQPGAAGEAAHPGWRCCC